MNKVNELSPESNDKPEWKEEGFDFEIPCIECGGKREDRKWNICFKCYAGEESK